MTPARREKARTFQREYAVVPLQGDRWYPIEEGLDALDAAEAEIREAHRIIMWSKDLAVWQATIDEISKYSTEAQSWLARNKAAAEREGEG